MLRQVILDTGRITACRDVDEVVLQLTPAWFKTLKDRDRSAALRDADGVGRDQHERGEVRKGRAAVRKVWQGSEQKHRLPMQKRVLRTS